MSGGGSQTSNTVANPWAGAEPYLKELLQQGSALHGQGTDYTKEYQGLSDTQKDLIGKQQEYYAPGGGWDARKEQANSALESMLGATDVANNKQVQDLIAANTTAANQQLTEGLLPAVRSGASASGNYGSTRQGIAEGVAQGKTADALAGANANVLSDAYSQGLKQQMAGMGYLNQVQGMDKQANEALFDYENLLNQDKQGQIDMDYWNKTEAPWQGMDRWSQLLFPAAGMGGSTSTTSPGASQGARLAGAGMAGLGAYGALSSSVAAGPYAPLAAGAMALMSYMGS